MEKLNVGLIGLGRLGRVYARDLSTRIPCTRVVAVADVGLARRPDGKVHFVRVNGDFADDGRYHVRPVAAQGSHQLAATALADALAVVPDGDGVPEGGDVAVLLLDR